MGLFSRKKNRLQNPPDHPVQPPPPAAPTTNGEKVETNRLSGQLTDRLSSVPDGRPPEPSQVRDVLARQSDAQRVWSHPQKQAQDWRHLWDERNQESRARVPGIVPPVENPFRDFSRHNQNSVNQVTISKPPSPLAMPYDDQQSTSPRRSKAHRRRRVDESNEPPSPLAMPYDDQQSTSPRRSKAHRKGRIGHMTLLDRADRVSETFPNEMFGEDSVNQFTINEPPSPLAMPYDDQQSTSPRSSKAHRKGHMAILDRADRVSETFQNETFGDEAAAEYEHQSNIENGSVQDITAVHSTIVQSIQFCLKSKKGPKTKRFNIDMNAVKDIASLFTASPYQLGLQETQTTSSNQFDCDFTKGQMRLGADVEKSCQFGNASERANFFEQSPRLNCLEQLASVSCGRNLHKLMNRQFEGVLSDLPDKCSSSSDTTCSCSCGDEDTPIDPCKKNKKAKKHVLKCQGGTVLQSTISSQCNTCKDELIKDCCPEQYPQIYAQESPSMDDYSTVNAPNQPEIFSICSSRKRKKTHQRKAKDSRKISEFTFHSHGIHLQAKWPSPPEERFCCGPNGYEKVSSCCDHGSLQSGCHAGPGCTSIKACSKSCHEGRCKCCSPRKPYPHASYFEREPRCFCSCNQNQISAFRKYEPTDRESETAFFQREMPSQRSTNDLLKAAIPCKCEPFDNASVNREQKGVTSERNCKGEETICESQNHLNHPCMKQSISEPRAGNSPNSPGLNKCCDPCKPCKQDFCQSKPYEQCMPCKPSAVYESCESPFESNELNTSCVPSCKLNEPNKPCEPSYKPSEPCQPCEPSYKSSESYQNCKPCYKSNEPCQPCGPSYKSREPGKPCEPSYKPSEPCQPCEPSYKPSEPCQPCEPSYKPSEPCQPCDPSCKSSESYQNCKPCYKSNEPCQPCDPSYKSNEPCQPCEAYCKSDKPNKPCEPSYKSREPSKPCEPSYKSREPSKPCEPKETYKPCEPPVKPSELYKSCDPPYKPSESYEVDKGLESKKDHSNHGKTNTDSENKTLADGAETNCKQMSPHSEDGNSNKIQNGPCIPEKKKIDKENSYTFKGCHQGALNDKSRFSEGHGLFCWGAEEKTSNQEFDGCAEEGDCSEPCDPCDAGPCVGGICYRSCREKQGEDTKIRPNCSKGETNSHEKPCKENLAAGIVLGNLTVDDNLVLGRPAPKKRIKRLCNKVRNLGVNHVKSGISLTTVATVKHKAEHFSEIKNSGPGTGPCLHTAALSKHSTEDNVIAGMPVNEGGLSPGTFVDQEKHRFKYIGDTETTSVLSPVACGVGGSGSGCCDTFRKSDNYKETVTSSPGLCERECNTFFVPFPRYPKSKKSLISKVKKEKQEANQTPKLKRDATFKLVLPIIEPEPEAAVANSTKTSELIGCAVTSDAGASQKLVPKATKETIWSVPVLPGANQMQERGKYSLDKTPSEDQKNLPIQSLEQLSDLRKVSKLKSVFDILKQKTHTVRKVFFKTGFQGNAISQANVECDEIGGEEIGDSRKPMRDKSLEIVRSSSISEPKESNLKAPDARKTFPKVSEKSDIIETIPNNTQISCTDGNEDKRNNLGPILVGSSIGHPDEGSQETGPPNLLNPKNVSYSIFSFLGGENKTIEDLAIREENNAETKQDYFCIGLQRQKEQQHPCEEEKQISPQKPNKYEKNEEDMKKTACNVFWPCRDPPKSKDSSLCDDWKERQRKGKNDSLRLNKRSLCKKSRRKKPKDSKSEQDSDGCSICASTQNPLQEQRSGDRKRNHSSFDNPPSKQNEILVPRRDSSIDELCRAAVKAMRSLSSSQESKHEGYDGAGHPQRLEPGVSISVEEIKRIFINQKDCYEGTKPSKKTSKDSKGGKARTWSPKALYDTFTQNYIEGRQTKPGSNTEGQKLFFQTASANSSISSCGLRKIKRLKDNTSESTKEAKHSIGPGDIPRSSTSSKHKWLQSSHKSTRANTQQKSSRMSSPLAVSGSSTDQDCSWTCEEIGPPSPCAQCCSPHPAEPYADHTIDMCFGEEIHRSLLLTSNSSHPHSGHLGIEDELCLSDSLSCLCSGDKKSVTSVLSDDELKCLNQSKSSNKCPVTCCCSQCIDLYVKKKQNTDGQTSNQPTFRDGTQKPSETEKLGEEERLSYQSLKEIFQKLYSEVMEPDKDRPCKKHKVSKRQERECDKKDVQAYRRRAPDVGGCSSCKKEVRYRRMSPQRYAREQSDRDQCEPESSHEQIDHTPRARYICCCECKCPALSGPGSNNSLTTDYTRSKQCDMRRKTETFCGGCSPASGYSNTSRFALKSKTKEGKRARHCVRPTQRCHCDTLEAFRYRDLCHQCPSDCMCKILSPKQTPESLQSSRCSLCTVPCACSARSEGRQEQILGLRQRPSSEEKRLHKIMELCSGILSTYVNTCDKVQEKDLGKSKPKIRKNRCIHCSKRAQKRGEKKVKPKSPRRKSKKLRKSSSPTPPLHNTKCKKCKAISATFVDGSDALTDSRHKEKVSRAKKRRKSRSPSSVSSTSPDSLSGSLKRKSKKRRLGKKKRKGQSKSTSSGQSTSGTSLRSGTDNSSSVRSSVSSCESLGSNSDSSSFKSRLKRKREKRKRVQKKVKVRATQTVLDKVIENKRKISDTLSCQTKRLLQLEQNIDRNFMQKKAEMNTARSEQILGSKFDCIRRLSQDCAPHRSYSLCWPGKTNSLKANSYNVICGNKDAFPKTHGYNRYTSHYECSSPPRSSFGLATRYYRKSPTCSRYGFKRRGCFYNFRRNASPDHTSRAKYFCPFKGKTNVSSRASYKQQNNSRKSFDLNTEMGSPNLQTNASSFTFGNVERQTENDAKLLSYRTSPQPHLYDQHGHEPGTQMISRNSDPSTKTHSLYGQEKTSEEPIPRNVNQKESDAARKPSLRSEIFDQNEPVPQSTPKSGGGQGKLPRSLSPEFFEAGQDMTQNWQRSRPCTARTACRVLRRQSDYSAQTTSYGKPAASKKSKESQKLLQSKNDLAIGKHKTAKCHTKEPATKTSDLSDGEVCVGNIEKDRSRMFDFASFHASSCRTNNHTAPKLLVPTSAAPKDCVNQEESISSIGIKEDSNKKARKVETLGEKMEMIFKISPHVVEKPLSDVAIVPCQSSAFCEEINEEHVPHKDFEGHSQIDIENIVEPVDICENDCQIVDLTEE